MALHGEPPQTATRGTRGAGRHCDALTPRESDQQNEEGQTGIRPRLNWQPGKRIVAGAFGQASKGVGAGE